MFTTPVASIPYQKLVRYPHVRCASRVGAYHDPVLKIDGKIKLSQALRISPQCHVALMVRKPKIAPERLNALFWNSE